MEDKRELLKQIGWSDQLIEKCLSGRIPGDASLYKTASAVLNFVEQDVTDLTVNLTTPVISDGTHLV